MESLPPVTEPPPSSEFITFDPERHPPREITPMTQASIAGDLDKVQEILNSYLLAQGSQNPKLYRFILDDWELTKWFLDRGADPNAGCYLDYTPMSCAVKSAPMRTVKLLFERGGDIKKGQLIHHAVEGAPQDVIEMLDLLLQMGAQLNERKCENHWPSWNMTFFMGLGTPLHEATRGRNLQVVDYLLRKGADVKVKDSMHRTALYYASREGFSEISKLLEKREKEVEEKEREDGKGSGPE